MTPVWAEAKTISWSKPYFAMFGGDVMHAVEQLVIEAHGPFQVLVIKIPVRCSY